MKRNGKKEKEDKKKQENPGKNEKDTKENIIKQGGK